MIEYNGTIPLLPKDPKHSKTSNNIITLDIETTSLFEYDDGWRCFRPKLPPAYYAGRRKAAVPYIWMMGFETRNDGIIAIYGRDFFQLGEVFRKLSQPHRKHFVYIHNLSWEMQFLRDVFEREGWTVEKMLSRAARKPISFYVPEINFEFRCSYMLTGLSLERAAEQYAEHTKKTGDLIYTVPRSPLTKLSEKEIGYCEADVITLVEIMQHYRKEYGSLKKIPYTLTGEVRKELRQYVRHGDIMRTAKHTPELYVYMLLMKAFQGGITHACYLYADKLLHNITSGDMASAYPACMVSEKFPLSYWHKVPADIALAKDPDRWAILYHVRLLRFESRLFNRYMLGSKALHAKGLKMDNGRVISGDMIELVLTEVDYKIICDSYDIGEIEYIETYVNRKSYLPLEMIKYVIELYHRKTTLKGVKGQEDLYRRSKSRVNALFGCACTNILKQTSQYVDGEWITKELTTDFIQEKLDELRNSSTNCFSYSVGVWITAYCRRRTWGIVSALDPVNVGIDKGACYYDTDSCKAPPSTEFTAAMEASNAEFMEMLTAMCKYYDIDIGETAPCDPKGNKHQIGLWEIDANYQEFKTLGAKRYAYREAGTNKLKITVSGVKSSTGRKALKDDLNNFKKDMLFDYDHSGKMISCYEDDQPELTFRDCDGNMFTSTQKHGIALMPTTYKMTIDPIYELLYKKDFEGGISLCLKH